MTAQKYRQLNALAMVAAMLIAACLLLVDRWHSEYRALHEEISVQAALIGSNASAALAFDDKKTARAIVSTAVRSPSLLEAVLYESDRQAVASFTRSGYQSTLPAILPVDLNWSNDNRLLHTLTIEESGQVLGYIAVRADPQPVHIELYRFLLGLAVIAAIAVGFVRFATRGTRERVQEAEAALQQMALYDHITRLGNRFSFEQELEHLLQRSQRESTGAAMLFIDVDGFKRVNDTLGHHGGDQVLADIGERLKRALRGGDVVARIGGDEFGVILVDTIKLEDVAKVAENLIRIAAHPFEVAGAQAYIGFSIGIAMIPDDGKDIKTLMNHADLAMYHAKQNHKGGYQFFSGKIEARVSLRHALENALRQALSSDQLYVVYQPQIAAASGELIGLEALVRWRHPERGIISPADFIPIAEDSGLIVEVGQQVIEKVCRDIHQLKADGYAVPPVAVNLSARQFMLGNLLADITDVTQRYQLGPSDIELELTESVLMERLDARLGILDQLEQAGYRLAIDDFGTGYSSLSYLRHLKVDKLKIDMSFIRTLPEDVDSLAIVSGIIGMAHAIGLTVVAEGVETESQLNCLRNVGCDFIQGYFTGKPMEKSTLLPLLQRLS